VSDCCCWHPSFVGRKLKGLGYVPLIGSFWRIWYYLNFSLEWLHNLLIDDFEKQFPDWDWIFVGGRGVINPGDSPNNQYRTLAIANFNNITYQIITTPLIILASPMWSGKSTIGPILANKLKFAFIENDHFQTEINITKWENDIYIEDDESRWEWYDRSVQEAFHIEDQSPFQGIILECAAPKKLHRDRLRMTVQYLKEPGRKLLAYCIFCTVREEESFKRVQKRVQHPTNAGANLVARDYAVLEIPKIEGPDKEENVFLLDCNGAMENNILEALKLIEMNIEDIINGKVDAQFVANSNSELLTLRQTYNRLLEGYYDSMIIAVLLGYHERVGEVCGV
jgi:carbohydrate kinase (thermoresistant glucokinase family)